MLIKRMKMLAGVCGGGAREQQCAQDDVDQRYAAHGCEHWLGNVGSGCTCASSLTRALFSHRKDA